MYWADLTFDPVGPDQLVHWHGILRNNASCTVSTSFRVQLQTRTGYSGGFTPVGSPYNSPVMNFPPGDTAVSGTFCYVPPAGQIFENVYAKLNAPNPGCQADHLSEFRDAARPSACAFGMSFSDVSINSSYYAGLSGLVGTGAVSGYSDGTFRPNNSTTRAQLAKIVVTTFGIAIPGSAEQHFSDVATSNPFYGYIEAAYAKGLISGYGDGTFRPNNNVTRGQVAKVIVQAAGVALVNPSSATFSDVPVGSTYFSFVETAYANRYISGYSNGTFGVNSSATRGQIAQITGSAAGVQVAKLPWGGGKNNHR